ncbi:MAG: ClpXP protease specificity-enhancing factor SspB [Rhodospirillales bacterium]|jgi:hypothetical protein|nr:ClpXP protease specificity-enhancing factor SspB [Rhodospirillales bacterium]HJO72700.1 ClpXP protease specificity-enhancing factor SspB [Rhodospirillales bacterium]
MEETPLRYDVWVKEALRGVIRRALAWVSENDLPSDHHFYITFETGADGVEIPYFLHTKHPEEMTIVIQHRYRDLVVADDAFEVTLTFKGVSERLRIPLEAVTAFADPAVNFGLQLKVTEASNEEDNIGLAFVAGESPQEEPAEVLIAQEPDAEEPAQSQEAEELAQSQEKAAEEKKSGEIIALDKFRKK